MKNIWYTIFLLFTFVVISQGQISTRLVTITEGDPTNLSGLGYSFYGAVMNDGNLYFRGSGNGLRDAVWKTDGTIAATSKVVEEENMFGGNWDELLFVNEGALMNDNGDWSILSPGSNSFSSLGNMPNERIERLQLEGDTYYFTTSRDDILYLHTANLGFTEVDEIGSVHSDSYSVLLTSGPYGAFIFNTNSFQENTPKIYLKSTNELKSVEEYFSSLSISFSDLSNGYIIDNYLIASYMDADNFFQNKIINMADNSIADFPSIWEPLSHHTYEGDLILITQREVVHINSDDLSSVKIFDEVFSFSTSLLTGDKLYVQGRIDNFNEGVVEIDLSNNTSRYMDEGNTGNSFYSCEMEYYNGDFYYISEDEHQLLMRYDFDANKPEVVDTLSVVTGATVEHALQTVKGNLVISKRIEFQQHELYVLGNGISTNTENIDIHELQVYPTITEHTVQINSNSILEMSNFEVLLFDVYGRTMDTRQISNGILEVHDLPSSQYYGLIKIKDKVYRIQFIKI